MIKTELNRALFSKSFAAASLLTFAMLLTGGCDFVLEYLSGYISPGTYLEKFLISFGYGMTSLIAVLFPIVVMIPYTLSYRKERDSGYQQLMVLKSSAKTYRIAKATAAACSGFLVFFLPNLCWLLICRFMLGTGSTKYPILYGVGFAESLYKTYPFLYGLIYVFNAGIQGAVFALLGLGLSAVIRNRYLAVLLPFCYCIFSAAVLDAYNRGLNALSLMVIGQYYNAVIGYSGIVVYDIILVILGCILFIGGDRHVSKA